MPATVSHALSMTTPDNPAYENKPSNWNETHAVTLNLAGSEVSPVFSNANGVSFGLSGTAVTASVAGAAAGSVVVGANTLALGQVVFSNGSGVSFGLNGSTLTATVQTNYLTTAALSNHSHGNPTLALTNLSGTTASASNGLTLSLSAAAPLAATVFSNSNNVSFGLNGSTVTATATFAQSNQNVTAANGGFAFQTLSFSNANGVSFATSAGSAIVGSVATTYRASNDGVGLNTAQTNVTWTVNSSGISLNAGGYAGTGTSATNASVTLNSNGLAISVAAPGGGGAINVSAGTTSGNLQTLQFNDGNGVSFGLNGSTITASAAGGAAPASSSLVGANGVSLSTAGSTISIGLNQVSFFRQAGQITAAGTAQGNSLVSIQPFLLQRGVVFSNVLCAASFNVATQTNNSSAFQDVSLSGVIYSRSGATLSSICSFSNTLTRTWSSNASQTVTGVAGLTASLNQTTLSAGEYYVAFHVSTTNTATGGANTTALTHAVSMILSGSMGTAANAAKVWGAQTNQTVALFGGQGLISTGATRATIAMSDVTVSGTRGFLAPIFFEIRNDTYQL